MATDKLGLEFTAALPETVDAFNNAMDDYMLFTGEPVGKLLVAAEIDPDFAMGYCLTGCLRLFGGVSSAHPRVSLELRAAKARKPRVTLREQAHIDAFAAAASGEMTAAGKKWDSILAEYPHDMMAAKCAHEAYYLVGESERMRDSVLAVLSKWDEKMPYFGYLLGMGAFGLEESGNFRDAEDMGRRAIEIEPMDCWGIHALAHVLQMERRYEEGIEFLDGTNGDWSQATWLRGHLWWHLCLPLIETGRTDRVIAIYDRFVSDCDKDMVTRLNDCTSLLWRLELAGVDVGDRWDSLVEMWVCHIDEHAFAFADAHLAMTLISAGGEKKLGRFLESQHAYIEGHTCSNSKIIETVGRDICLGVIAFGRGEYKTAASHLGGVIDDTYRIGGSNAQRDLFRLTYEAAVVKSVARAAS